MGFVGVYIDAVALIAVYAVCGCSAAVSNCWGAAYRRATSTVHASWFNIWELDNGPITKWVNMVQSVHTRKENISNGSLNPGETVRCGYLEFACAPVLDFPENQ